MLNLGHNKLQGKLLRSLARCTMLESLDLGNNQLNDAFPSWLGALPKLNILILSKNEFHGTLGRCKSGSSFSKLQIIDLHSNNLTGRLPSDCFLRSDAMKIVDMNHLAYMGADIIIHINGQLIFLYGYSMKMTTKGVELEYSVVNKILAMIDLSCNNFQGGIPEVIGSLKGLHSLNLSNNILSGHISSSLKNLTRLESLDPSHNHLSGQIPQELEQLTFLEVFNVSQNHLSRPIPQGNQFSTFPSVSFNGNLDLCGNLECVPTPPSVEDKDSSSAFDFGWKIVLIGYASGAVVGIVMGHIVTKRKHDWFMETFRIKQFKNARPRRRGHRTRRC